MAQTFGRLVLLLLIFLGSNLQANAVEKHALIIANKNYVHGGSLTNPIKDSRELYRALTDAGFRVRVMENLTLDGMRKAISDFGWEHSETDNVTMLYYSGHGAEFDGENYLIPVDAKLDDARRARSEAITLSDVQNFMYREISDEDRAKGINANGLNIIVLDACRNNPYPARKKSAASGLAEVEGASGTLIWYAAQPGAQADDGDGEDLSPFASAFTKALEASSGETVEETFKQIARLTLRATDGLQEPWQAGNILGRFSFKKGNRLLTNSRVLADYDPSRLDMATDLFKFDNPQKISINNFGVWNLGMYRFMVPPFNEVIKFEPGYRLKFRMLPYETGGPYGETMWQEFQPGSFAHFSWNDRTPSGELTKPHILFELNITKQIWNQNCSDYNCSETFEYEMWFESDDGHELNWPDDFTKQKQGFYCLNFCELSFQFPALKASEIDDTSYLVFEYRKKDKGDVRSEYEKIRVPLAGLSEASKHLNELENFEELLLEPVKFSKLDLLMSELMGSPDQAASFYGSHRSWHTFVDKYGVEEFEKFRILFDRSLDIDFSSYGGLCVSDPSESLFLLSGKYERELEDNPIVSDTWVAAKKLHSHLSEVWIDRMHDGDITCAPLVREEAVSSPAEHFKALIMIASAPAGDSQIITNIISNHKFFFPEGNGLLSYRELKAFADTVERAAWEEELYEYLNIVKEQEIQAMRGGAWEFCSKLTEAALTEGISCYREFVTLFPNSEKLEQATSYIKELENESECQTSAAVWKFMSDSTNIKKLEEFASQHPYCLQSESALERIKQLEDS